ncbi:MAG: lytic murein transglycosylase, partial [Cypionkella sp.]
MTNAAVILALALSAGFSAPHVWAQDTSDADGVEQSGMGPMMTEDQGSVAGFDAWRVQFRGRALAQGVSAAVFDEALGAAEFLPAVVDRDRRQDEFSKTIWD